VQGGREQLILESPAPKYATDWSRDGRYLVYSEINPQTRLNELWILEDPMNPGARKPVLVGAGSQGQISPDGKWLAYYNAGQIKARPFPTGEGVWQVSTEGGIEPRWRADGRELFYLRSGTPIMQMMSVAVAAGPRPFADDVNPQKLFEYRGSYLNPRRSQFDYSPSGDGKRFLVRTYASTAQPTLDVLVNWQAGLKK